MIPEVHPREPFPGQSRWPEAIEQRRKVAATGESQKREEPTKGGLQVVCPRGEA